MNKISGIGIDIVNVSRFKIKLLEDNLKFYEKIFSDSEIEYCKKFKSPYEHFAGIFAVKEALIKSIDEDIGLLEIVIEHENNKPVIKLKTPFNEKYRFIVSISHEKEFAVGVVVSEKIK